MNEAVTCSLICLIIVGVLNILLAIACASWQVNENNSSRWRNKILNFYTQDLGPLKILDRSWNTKPFVDMTVTSETYCPSSHPDEVVYQTWLGTRGVCDCLNAENFRDYSHENCGD